MDRCGREGRVARAVVRGALMWGDGLSFLEEAIDHIARCDNCMGAIAAAIANNPETIYTDHGDTPKDVLAAARQMMSRGRSSWW